MRYMLSPKSGTPGAMKFSSPSSLGFARDVAQEGTVSKKKPQQGISVKRDKKSREKDERP